jgi:hypothetical protein
MKFEIKHRFTGAVLFALETRSMKLCVEAAIKSNADLRDADLSGADLCGVNLRGVPKIKNIDAQILAAIESGGTLDTREWHTCDTTHCRAGWAVHLAGEGGAALEWAIGTPAAAAMIYLASRPDQRIPDFYCDNETAMADIRKCAAEQLAAEA